MKYLTGFSALFVAISSSVSAVPLADLKTCYTRAYSAAHLRDQPKQNVATLALTIDAEKKAVMLSGTDREGSFGYLYFSCYEVPGDETRNPVCSTFELDNVLGIEPQNDGAILINVRNAYLSDVGIFYYHLRQEELTGHHLFYLEGTPEENPPMRGPWFGFRLFPSPSDQCLDIGYRNVPGDG